LSKGICPANGHVANGFDVVAVRVSHETAEVVGVVLGKGSRCIQDLSIDAAGGVVKSMYGRPVASGERDVQFPRSPTVNGWTDPKWGTLVIREANPVGVGVGGLEPKRRQNGLVEGPTSGDIGDLK
jgi:hypothetical protein